MLTSLAGRVSRPALPVGRVRIGGFGGADGLADFLTASRIAAVVDATHPFAARISANAAAAAARTGKPLLRLERHGWVDHPLASAWTWVPDVRTAIARSRTGSAALPDHRPPVPRSVPELGRSPGGGRPGRRATGVRTAGGLDRDHLPRPLPLPGRAAALDRQPHRYLDHQGLGRGAHRRETGGCPRSGHSDRDHPAARTVEGGTQARSVDEAVAWLQAADHRLLPWASALCRPTRPPIWQPHAPSWPGGPAIVALFNIAAGVAMTVVAVSGQGGLPGAVLLGVVSLRTSEQLSRSAVLEDLAVLQADRPDSGQPRLNLRPA